MAHETTPQEANGKNEHLVFSFAVGHMSIQLKYDFGFQLCHRGELRFMCLNVEMNGSLCHCFNKQILLYFTACAVFYVI